MKISLNSKYLFTKEYYLNSVFDKIKLIQLVIFLFLFFPIIANCQFSVHNELNCDFSLTLKCNGSNSIFEEVRIGDSLHGDWGAPNFIELSNENLCGCDNLSISLKSNSSNHMISFTLKEYRRYLDTGGKLSDYANPLNTFIFCCRNFCNIKAPCAIESSCGYIEIEGCTLKIKKPLPPFCN